MLPVWLRIWIQSALIGEVYPNIRAIAIRYTENRKLTLRFYLDREPTEFDFDSISMVVAEIMANVSSKNEIAELNEECFFSDNWLKDIDCLDGLVYARREYELE